MLKRTIVLCLISAALTGTVMPVGGQVPATMPATQPAAPARSAGVILAELKALAEPPLDAEKARTDTIYHEAYLQVRADHMAKRAPLTLELYKVAPDTLELVKYLPERWQELTQEKRYPEVIAEITEFLEAHPDSTIKPMAAMQRVLVKLESSARDGDSRRAALAEFEKASPDDKRLPSVLKKAFDATADIQEKREYLAQMTRDFADNRATVMAGGELKAVDAIGKPFELAFTDVVSGRKISIADLKGKVVVLDFWATWCQPCVAEMPKMKSFYERYQDKGVEVIGVSLDYAGDENIQKIKDFVAENQMAWPQYYQGNGWDSAFSAGWGVASIPCVFVIDAEGKLASITARGKLDVLVPALLKQRDEAAQRAASPEAAKPELNGTAQPAATAWR